MFLIRNIPAINVSDKNIPAINVSRDLRLGGVGMDILYGNRNSIFLRKIYNHLQDY